VSPDAPRARGLLVAIVGPSGAGKDTVTRLALERLGDHAEPIRLARRVVTRTADGASEDHDTLDEAAFAHAEAAGAFCLTWRANGLAYGLPAGIRTRIDAGEIVVANLSRRSLSEAAARFGRIAIVEIVARRELLLARITARGRETSPEIEARLARTVPTEAPPGALALLRIDNSGAPDDAAAELQRFLQGLLRTLAQEAAGADEPSSGETPSASSHPNSARAAE
jgi:ribose 1,5-bisphosphokinase